MKPIHITSIKTDPDDNHGERLSTQNEFMKRVIMKYPPSVVYIEKGFSRHAISTQAIFKTVGVYNLLLKDYETDYFAPTTVKKVITGNGRAKKDSVQNELMLRYPDIEFKNEDESDALGVVLTGLIKNNLIEWSISPK